MQSCIHLVVIDFFFSLQEIDEPLQLDMSELSLDDNFMPSNYGNKPVLCLLTRTSFRTFFLCVVVINFFD